MWSSMKSFSFDLNAEDLPKDLEHVDLCLSGIDESGPSYEGRVFINNPAANESTAKTPENGYAASFYVFGHEGCIGDPGHCEWEPGVREFDKRGQHMNLPIDVIVSVRDAVERELKNGNRRLQVTIVPVLRTSAATPKHPSALRAAAARFQQDLVFKSDALPVKSKLMVRGDGVKTLDQAVQIPAQ